MAVGETEFKNMLKKHGLKVTNQRIVILKTLANFPGQHLTTEEIYDRVKTEFPEIGLATVYRTLQVFLELKLLDTVNLNDGFTRYEIVEDRQEGRNIHHHHHLICLECKTVFSFEDDLLEGLENRIQNTMGFSVIDHEVKLYGYCKECRKQIKEKK